MRRRCEQRRQGLTLSEAAVVAAVACIVVTLLLPSLLAAREKARRQTCEARLARLLWGTQNFESSRGFFPSGTVNPDGPIENTPRGLHQNWILQLLPFLNQQPLFDEIDPQVSIYAAVHAQVRTWQMPELRCPTASEALHGSNYAGCHSDREVPIDQDNPGTFFLNSRISVADIRDGLDYTLFLGEKVVSSDDLGWFSGTRATLRNTGTRPQATEGSPRDPFFVGGFGSSHIGHTHLGRGSGAVNFTDNSIDIRAYQQLGHRSDGSGSNVLSENEK